MTTIVYDHKNGQIACDGLITRSDVIMGKNFHKWVLKDGVYYFFSGATSDIEYFLENCGKHGTKVEPIPNIDCFMVQDGVVYESSFDPKDGYWKFALLHNSAIGSGSNFALAALDFGESARAAVEYAARRDCYTGGEVFVFDIKTLSFLSVQKS